MRREKKTREEDERRRREKKTRRNGRKEKWKEGELEKVMEVVEQMVESR